jgi:cytochrome c oxidase subunit 2
MTRDPNGPAMDAPSSAATEGELPTRFERLHTAERWWLRFGVVMLIAFLSVVLFDALRNASVHSHGSRSIAPELVATTAPFDKPGTYRNADGTWDAVVVAYAFGFLPRADLVVPVDTEVHFKVASIDVVHGFTIPGRTNVNLEVLPGHVSEVTQTFRKPGRYLILCNEYCGSGHHFMTSHIRVLRKGEDPAHPPELGGGPETNAAAAAASMEDMHMTHDGAHE